MPQCINFSHLANLALKNRTTGELGQLIGLSQPSVSRLASGRTADISARVGIKLIDVVGGRITLPKEAEEVAAMSRTRCPAGNGKASRVKDSATSRVREDSAQVQAAPATPEGAGAA